MSEDKEVFQKIHVNYKHMNQMMVEEMDLASEHDGLTGGYREKMWMDFFRSIIPKKFSLEQGVMIIDSDGRVSKEVDIAVFDEQYTPYVFQYNTLKFIPIEAVVIVIECKSKNWDEDQLTDWSASIKNLTAKQSGISRIMQGYASGITNKTQKCTNPIKILACIKEDQKEETIINKAERLEKHFDIILQKNAKDIQKKDSKRFEVKIHNEDKTLGWWGSYLNNKKHDHENGAKIVNENLPLQHLSGIQIPCKNELSDDELRVKEQEEKERLLVKKEVLKKDFPELTFDDELNLTNTLKNLNIEGNPLLSLNLQLNQLLMLLNNPMLFPHFAYADKFYEIIEKYENPSESES